MTVPFPFFLPQDTPFHWSSGLLKKLISCWHTSPQLAVLSPWGWRSTFLMPSGYGTDWWKFMAISGASAYFHLCLQSCCTHLRATGAAVHESPSRCVCVCTTPFLMFFFPLCILDHVLHMQSEALQTELEDNESRAADFSLMNSPLVSFKIVSCVIG